MVDTTVNGTTMIPSGTQVLTRLKCPTPTTPMTVSSSSLLMTSTLHTMVSPLVTSMTTGSSQLLPSTTKSALVLPQHSPSPCLRTLMDSLVLTGTIQECIHQVAFNKTLSLTCQFSSMEALPLWLTCGQVKPTITDT